MFNIITPYTIWLRKKQVNVLKLVKWLCKNRRFSY